MIQVATTSYKAMHITKDNEYDVLGIKTSGYEDSDDYLIKADDNVVRWVSEECFDEEPDKDGFTVKRGLAICEKYNCYDDAIADYFHAYDSWSDNQRDAMEIYYKNKLEKKDAEAIEVLKNTSMYDLPVWQEFIAELEAEE